MLISNFIPRRLAGRFMGWFSTIEQPLVAALSIRALALFAGDLRLHEAQTQEFRSLRDCFTRRLQPGARPIDSRADVIVSPCDGIVMAQGRVRDTTLIQAKGRTYTLEELLGDAELVERHRGGAYVTLRLTVAMYHHFHAPCDVAVDAVRFVPGDSWNVNPATVARVDRVYCRNTRAVVAMHRRGGTRVLTLVPVGAVLVSSIHLEWIPEGFSGAGVIRRSAVFGKGDEMGHFEHGSTVIVLADRHVVPAEGIREGALLRVGQPLWHETDGG